MPVRVWTLTQKEPNRVVFGDSRGSAVRPRRTNLCLHLRISGLRAPRGFSRDGTGGARRPMRAAAWRSSATPPGNVTGVAFVWGCQSYLNVFVRVCVTALPNDRGVKARTRLRGFSEDEFNPQMLQTERAQIFYLFITIKGNQRRHDTILDVCAGGGG